MTDILAAVLNRPTPTVSRTTPMVHDTDGRLLKKIPAIRPALAQPRAMAATVEAPAIAVTEALASR